MSGAIDVSEGARGAREGSEMSERPVVVCLDGVTKIFDDAAAVDNVSLEIHDGEFFSLLGPSGCGKTTSLRMLAGFEEPTSGRILLGGVDVTYAAPYHRDVNTVFQSYALFPHLNVFENVAFGLRRQRMDKSEIVRRVGAMLELVDLPHMEKRRAAQLSGGQQQRVALARAMVNEPKLLLLDEPMSALDAKLRRQMQIELKRIQREVGITFLYVTHDQEEAMTMSDRLAVMRDGKIEGIGSPRQVYDSPSTEFVATFLGASNLLSGRVAGEEGSSALITLGDATTVRAPLADVRALGGTAVVKVGVRPEKISLLGVDAAVPTDHNSLRGQVRVSTFTGVGNQYLVDTDEGVEMTVYAQNIGQATAPRSGEFVTLSWPVEHTFAVRPMSVDRDSENGE